jgi:hypothetical protein
MLIERKVFELPTEDVHQLKVIEIGEMKKVTTKFGVKDKFTVKFEVLDQKSEEGEDAIWVFQTFAPSIGDLSNLGKFLRRLGYNTSSGTFEMDDLLGVKFTASIVHNEGSNKAVYANIVIETVKPARAVTGKSVTKTRPAPEPEPEPEAQPIDDSDIPF